MSRTIVGMTLAIVLGFGATSAGAQTDPNAGLDSMAVASVFESRMVDMSLPTVSDPAAVEMLFQEGSPILTILEGLKQKGFHIEYKAKHFDEEMTLVSLPKAERIDELLREIVEPWNFKVRRSPLGQWIVAPNKKKISTGMDPRTQELLDRYKNKERSQAEEEGN